MLVALIACIIVVALAVAVGEILGGRRRLGDDGDRPTRENDDDR